MFRTFRTTPGGSARHPSGYAVRYGAPVSDFGSNMASSDGTEFTTMTAAYPVIFPFGRGGFDFQSRRGVSFQEHVRWAIEYYDQRFAVHHSFPFVAFGLLQKQQALQSAKVYMRRRDFEKDSAALSRIRSSDICEAAGQQQAGVRPSNQAVCR